MAPTWSLYKFYGATATSAVIPYGSTVALEAEESLSTVADKCVKRPTSGSCCSHWSNFYILLTALGGSTVTGYRWYSDGTNNLGTGIQLWTTNNPGSYSGQSSPNDCLAKINTVAYPGITSVTDMFTHTSSSPRIVGLLTSISTLTTSPYTVPNHFILQVCVDSTAMPGKTPKEQIFVSLDFV